MANAPMNVKYITNRKGGQNLALDRFIFRIYRKTAGKIFCRCVVTGCSAALSTANNIPTGFGRQQNKQTPPLPKTQADIRLEGKWTGTATGDRFILFHDTHRCPNHCNQIYSIHIQINNIMIPIVYAFLPGKSQATYTHFFPLLKDKMTDLGLLIALYWTSYSYHNALKNVFPNTAYQRILIPLYACHMEKDTNLGTADSVPRQRQREDQRTMTFKDTKTSWWNYPTPCKEVPKRRPPTS